MRRGRAGAAALGLVLAASALTGCSDGERTLTVLAAASLTETFTELADEFEADHPDVTVNLAFDSSATLAQQAVDGAPGDVLATADLSTMQVAADGGALAEDAQVFATNTMVIVTPPANSADVRSVADLGDDAVTYVVCVDTAPCGTVAAALLTAAGIDHAPASLEPDVKAVLAKVTADEADAGLVYATDAIAAADAVTRIEIDGADQERTTYPIALLGQAQDAALAREFVDLVLGADGQSLLAEAGFGPP